MNIRIYIDTDTDMERGGREEERKGLSWRCRKKRRIPHVGYWEQPGCFFEYGRGRRPLELPPHRPTPSIRLTIRRSLNKRQKHDTTSNMIFSESLSLALAGWARLIFAVHRHGAHRGLPWPWSVAGFQSKRMICLRSHPPKNRNVVC